MDWLGWWLCFGGDRWEVYLGEDDRSEVSSGSIRKLSLPWAYFLRISSLPCPSISGMMDSHCVLFLCSKRLCPFWARNRDSYQVGGDTFPLQEHPARLGGCSKSWGSAFPATRRFPEWVPLGKTALVARVLCLFPVLSPSLLEQNPAVLCLSFLLGKVMRVNWNLMICKLDYRIAFKESLFRNCIYFGIW